MASPARTDPCQVEAYARGVVEGRVIAGRLVRLACQRHLNDLRDGPARGLKWDAAAAKRAITFFGFLRLPKDGELDGQAFALQPFQQFIVGSLFGWKGEDGHRRFRTAYVEVGKGNGKSPLAGAIGIYGLVADGEAAAEVYSAATKLDQAKILWVDACRMVEASPSLRSKVEKVNNSLVYAKTGSFFRPVSSEKRGLDGPRPHMGLIDELHEHPDATVVDKIRAGTKARRQALIFEITNALAIDTPIATPDGWKMMGDLQPGDRVFDETGAVCNVTAVSAVMSDHQCYRVVFDEGSEIVADAGHLWKTTQRRGCQPREDYLAVRKASGKAKGQRRKSGEPNTLVDCECGCGEAFLRFDAAGRPRRCVAGHNTEARSRVGIRTTQEIKDTVRYQRFSNHNVELAGPLLLPEADLPVDPYTLGCWLGDGNSKDTGLLVVDGEEEILANVAAGGVSVGRKRPVGRRDQPAKNLGLYGLGVTGTGRRDSLQSTLRRIGVLNNKHIPEAYFRASTEQRLALLQGLMDTDGHIAPRTGRCVFTQSRRGLALQVAELVNTLGMKCIVRHDLSKLKGEQFDRWDVFFYPPWELKVFGLKRKQRHNLARHGRKRMSQNRQIVEVQAVPSVPVKCIAVDSPSHLFLAGRTLIPTHNSGYDRTSVCWQHRQFSAQVLEGLAENDSWFAYVCQLDVCDAHRDEGQVTPVDGCEDCDDWRDESIWEKVNPGLDTILPRKYLREQAAEAEAMPAKRNIVLRLNFCIWTESAVHAIPMDRWDACKKEVDRDALRGRECFGSIDLGATSDFTSFCLGFPHDDGETVLVPADWSDPDGAKIPALRRTWTVLWWHWLPERPKRRDPHMQAVIDGWKRQVWKGSPLIRTTPGSVVDYDQVLRDVLALRADYPYACVAVDRGFQGAQFCTNLMREVGEEAVVAFPQGIVSMNAPFREMIELVILGRLHHEGDPVTRWMASNCAAETRGGLIKPSKEHSKEKIDGIAAGTMMLGVGMVAPPQATPKVEWF